MNSTAARLIVQFILENPKRPFVEIEYYAQKIGATDTEISWAIEQVGHMIPQKVLNSTRFAKSQENIVSKTLQNIDEYRPLVQIGAVIIALVSLVLSSVYLFILTMQSQGAATVTKEVEKKELVTISDEPASSIIPVVYASQQIVDAKKTFSYPPSEVNLKYSGIPQREILGFLPYWMIDVLDDISLDELTSIAIFGLTTDGDGNIYTAVGDGPDKGWSMWNDNRLDRYIQKAKRKGISVSLVLKSFNNADIEKLIKSEQSQKRFISNAIQLVNSKSLDGINIDFEYVGDADATIAISFTRFLANLSSELKRQVPNAKLSVDTYASSAAAPQFFDIEQIIKYVDHIIVMGYDINTPKGEVGPVAPLEGSDGIIGYMQSYLDRIPSDKLILAVPYYGYDWPIGTDGKKIEGEVKIVPYAQIISENADRSILWNEISKTPYVRYVDTEEKLTRELHFENIRSLGLKYDFINDRNLAGVAVWALGYDGKNTELKQLLVDKFNK